MKFKNKPKYKKKPKKKTLFCAVAIFPYNECWFLGIWHQNWFVWPWASPLLGAAFCEKKALLLVFLYSYIIHTSSARSRNAGHSAVQRERGREPTWLTSCAQHIRAPPCAQQFRCRLFYPVSCCIPYFFTTTGPARPSRRFSIAHFNYY
jgi:hypothetical protein